MRPVRFVALTEDGQAFVLADEVGRLLALPIDDRIHGVLRHEAPGGPGHPPAETVIVLSPRDIQAKIRSGESADEVARTAGVPVDKVLRYAGPVLQERAMLAQHARRTKLRSSEKGASLADVVDARLAQHGVEAEKIAWDAYRREDGTWRIVATWPSGKATAQAVWELDRTRQAVSPHDDMARYLCTERPQPILGQEFGTERPDRPGRGLVSPVRPDAGRPELPGHGRADTGRGGHEPMRAPAPDAARRDTRSTRAVDPIRSGRDALLASLERPLSAGNEPAARTTDTAPPKSGGLAPRPPAPLAPAAQERPGQRPAARQGNLLGGPGSAFDDDVDAPKEVPAVPSLAVLRPRRAGAAAAAEPSTPTGEKRKRLPSWDDVLFGSAPARENG